MKENATRVAQIFGLHIIGAAEYQSSFASIYVVGITGLMTAVENLHQSAAFQKWGLAAELTYLALKEDSLVPYSL